MRIMCPNAQAHCGGAGGLRPHRPAGLSKLGHDVEGSRPSPTPRCSTRVCGVTQVPSLDLYGKPRPSSASRGRARSDADRSAGAADDRGRQLSRPKTFSRRACPDPCRPGDRFSTSFRQPVPRHGSVTSSPGWASVVETGTTRHPGTGCLDVAAERGGGGEEDGSRWYGLRPPSSRSRPADPG